MQGRDYAGVKCACMTGLNGTLNILHILYLYPHEYVRILQYKHARLLGDVMTMINAMILEAYCSNESTITIPNTCCMLHVRKTWNSDVDAPSAIGLLRNASSVISHA